METEQKGIDRRTFLKTTSMGGAALALSGGVSGNLTAAETNSDKDIKKVPTRILGKTGVPVSILGMGGGGDASGYEVLLRIGLNMGINYWDSSSMYGNGKNEEVIGQFFSKYPEDRKKVFQVTKATRVTDPEGMTTQLNQSLERMKTDYIDLYFMHGLQNPEALTPQIKAWVEQTKKEGKIKFFGFSCHGNMAKMLMAAANLGWIDALMASYNYQVMNNEDMKKAIDACVKAKVGLVAMKTMGQRIGPPMNMQGGRDGRGPGSADQPQGREGQPQGQEGQPQGPSPEMQSQSTSSESEDLSAMSHFISKGYTLEQAKLKVIWEEKKITVCVSDMSNTTLIKANVAAATDNIKLSDKDREMLCRLAQSDRSLYCQACMRCESIMEAESRIPDILRYMMYYNSYGKTDYARALFRELPEHIRSNLVLRDYSSAEQVCPNKIEIRRAMREAVRLLA
jgi:predicted aldo/keto reductase-like oxidoreductase